MSQQKGAQQHLQHCAARREKKGRGTKKKKKKKDAWCEKILIWITTPITGRDLNELSNVLPVRVESCCFIKRFAGGKKVTCDDLGAHKVNWLCHYRSGLIDALSTPSPCCLKEHSVVFVCVCVCVVVIFKCSMSKQTEYTHTLSGFMTE